MYSALPPKADQKIFGTAPCPNKNNLTDLLVLMSNPFWLRTTHSSHIGNMKAGQEYGKVILTEIQMMAIRKILNLKMTNDKAQMSNQA